MEQQQANLVYISLLLLLFTWTIYHYRYVLTRRTRIWLGGEYKKLPPGPPSWPVLGHIQLLWGQAFPHVVFQTLASTYGPLLSLRLGVVPVVIVSSSAMACHFFTVHDLTFASRPLTSVSELIHYGAIDVGWAPYGKYWRYIRRICQTHLFNPAKVQSTASIRNEEVTAAIRHIASQELTQSLHQTPTDVRYVLYQILSNFICRLVFNDSSRLDPGFDKMIQEIFFLNGVFNLGDYLPFIKWMDLQGYQRRMKRVAKQFDVQLQNIINEHRCRRRESTKNPEEEDFLDIFLGLAEEHHKDFNLTDDHVKACVVDMFLGGTDTSTTTIEWALSEILLKPRVLQRLQEELDTVIGRDRVVEESDIPQLPYLNAVVKETFRLHPAVPLLIPHQSTQACEVMGGYGIPAGTRLLVNVYAIGRDEAVWEDATTFKPERFLATTTPHHHHHGDITNEAGVWANPAREHEYKLLPFGAGRRVCPALSMGMFLIHFVLARFLHSFDWSPSPSHPLDMEQKFGLSLTRAKPLFAITKTRLPPSAY